MRTEFQRAEARAIKGRLACILFQKDAKPPGGFGAYLEGVPKERFEGKLLQTLSSRGLDKDGPANVLIVGIGGKDDFDLDNVRRACGLCVRHAGSIKEKELTIWIPSKIDGAKMEEVAQAASEGAVLASYRFSGHKSKEEDRFEVEKARIVMEDDLADAVAKGAILAEAQNFSRELDEQPANIATPEWVVKKAKALGKESGIQVDVFGKAELGRMGMGGILAVNQGSDKPPALIQLEYNKGKKLPLYCIVGKGINFDSGGISLKPSKDMHEMKYDKSGAMNVLGVFKAVSALKLPIRLLGLMPMTENMPSGSAQKPGDIIKAYNGKSVEVLNTDAEGRLVLMDALAYGAEQKPEYMIDMATLTGAIVVSLGRHAIGMFSNDDGLAEAIEKAGKRSFERVWRLPMWKEYTEMLKSDVADLQNISNTSEAGSITAAVFLKEFVGDVKWAHLDIAAVDMVKSGHPYLGSGASGIGVRLVTSALEDLATKR